MGIQPGGRRLHDKAQLGVQIVSEVRVKPFVVGLEFRAGLCGRRLWRYLVLRRTGSGDRIPLYGRIVAVADFFDALTSKRTYKSAQRFEDAVAALKKRTGTFFDPLVVVAFVKIKKTIKKILEANITIDAFIKEITGRVALP